jgi:hypothetical protein
MNICSNYNASNIPKCTKIDISVCTADLMRSYHTWKGYTLQSTSDVTEPFHMMGTPMWRHW